MAWQSDPLETNDLSDSDYRLTDQGAFPIVQSIRSALYFDSVRGFGEWRILISPRAQKMLRKARRADKRIFEIMIKKIKELSKGHFSADNHKRLNGCSTDVPIFEAKMTRDLRLVYQIDCAPEYDSDGEVQIIKIYGIYTHAQLDGRFWDSVSHQLARQGKEYSDRCNMRKCSRRAGQDAILPCSFPPRPESVLVDVPHNFLQLTAEAWEDIHTLLHLDKYVTLSQALLFSMLADLDVQHVFSVSHREKEIIEHPYSCYVLGRSGTGKTTTMLFKMLGIERAWELRAEEVPKVRQLFVTKSRILVEKVEEYFVKLMASLSTGSKSPEELKELAKAQKLRQEREVMVDKDEEVDYQSDLPARFSLLTEDHFPLFITFDQLCKLLEADIGEDPIRSHTSRKFVTAKVFLRSYWPHFPQTLTKGLDSSMVFSEFIGVIKGSERALDYEHGFVDQNGYEDLSSRTQPAFAHKRAPLYQLFQAYLKLKRQRGDYDTADRTHALIQSLQKGGFSGQEVDYLYVDEAQDNLLIDATILRALCKNPHGLFWAGDTAQTISVGSSFRFDDLKAFLFRIENKRQAGITNPSTTKEGPRMFQLAINYRSHAGIVNCAHSVIELITEFWPYTIDSLAPEQGIVDGSKPIFLSAQGQDTATYMRFLVEDKETNIEFGAEQCIIVRNDAAREELRGQVGDVGIIMTPYESKGLEFNDVLLYNFFQDSSMDFSQWRVLLNALAPSQRPARLPSFDETYHAGLCSELKILYVSITRARRNVWIVDSSETSVPMRVFWTSRDLVMTSIPSGTNGPRSLAVSSTGDEWAKTGRSLFRQGRYAHAEQCFKKANLHDEELVANAYRLREEAQDVPPDEDDSAVEHKRAFTAAAEAFIKSAASAILEKAIYYRIAAECFKECGNPPRAAQSYVDAGEFDIGAQLYRDAELFSQAIQVVREHRDKMQPDVVAGIEDDCRRHYFRNNELVRARSLFSSDKEALDFTENHDLNEAHVALLIKFDRRADAAQFYLSKGRTHEAHEILAQDHKNVLSVSRVTQYILSGLWEHFSLGLVPVNKRTKQVVRERLRLSTLLNDAMLNSNDRDEISMFRAISSMDMDRPQQLLKLGRKFCSSGTNIVSAVLCFDHAFDISRQATVLSGQDATANLPAFFDYARLLKKVAFELDPSKDVAVQKLLGIQLSSKNEFLIPIQTELHRLLRSTQMRLLESPEGMTASGTRLSEAVKISLRERLVRTLSLMGTVERSKDWPLSASLFFIRRVIHDKLPIDITALCGVLEYTCGSLVVSMNYQQFEVRAKSTFHKVVLPRSWLQVLLENIKEDNLINTPLAYVLVQPLSELLRVYSSMSRAASNYNMILSRICRCLCLLGRNVPMSGLRLEILRALTSLPKNLGQLHHLSHYVNARNWDDLVTAVHKSTLGFPADKLVELCHENEVSAPQTPVLNVERVTYKHIHDILGLLNHASPSESGDSSALLGGRRLMIGKNLSDDDGKVRQTIEIRDEGDVLQNATKLRDSHVAGTENDIGSTNRAPYQDFVPSEAKKHAADVLLHAFQRRLSRRRGVAKSPLSTKVAPLFSLCLEEAQHMEWQSGHIYRKVYLGALPHVLLCLKEVQKCAKFAKADVKERVKVAVHLEQEDLGKRRTELVQVLKTMDKLGKMLDPKSKMHRQRDISLLKVSALEVQTLFLQFPPRNVTALEEYLALALNAIVKASGRLAAAK